MQGMQGGLKIGSNRHENIASRVHAGWVENLVDSTRFDRVVTNRLPWCRFVIPEVDLRET